MDKTREKIESETNKIFFQLIWKKDTFKNVSIKNNYEINLIHHKGLTEVFCMLCILVTSQSMISAICLIRNKALICGNQKFVVLITEVLKTVFVGFLCVLSLSISLLFLVRFAMSKKPNLSVGNEHIKEYGY